MGLIATIVIGVALLTGVAVVLGLLDSPMSQEPVDRIDDGVPNRLMTSQDVGGLRFRIGLRGYRMDDVDLALERLRDSLRAAEDRSAAAEQAALESVAAAAPRRTRSRRAAPDDPPADEA